MLRSDVEKLTKSYIPMSEPSFLLLRSLLEERHGYAIMQDVLEMTGGRVTLGAGTVYTILYKMEQDNLITVAKEIDRRKIYRITPIGLDILRAEAGRIVLLSKIAGEVLDPLEIQKSMTFGDPAKITI